MGEELEIVKEKLSSAFSRKSKIVWSSTRFVKIGMVLLGSLLAAAFELFNNGFSLPLTVGQVGALFGCFLAFSGGVYVAVTDEDTTDVLETARRATELAGNQELTIREILELSYEYEDAIEQLTSLYTFMSVTRGTIERAVSQSHSDVKDVIQICLDAAQKSLLIASGFGVNEIWTICVYKAEGASAEKKLRLIAHYRSEQCEIENARTWRPGVGVGGVAFAKNDEVVVPDLDDPATGSAFRLDKNTMKEQDRERYKSLFAVPVQVGGDEDPWGVVMATSNVSQHFGKKEQHGVAPEEAVRALAGIVALAVAVCNTNGDES